MTNVRDVCCILQINLKGDALIFLPETACRIFVHAQCDNLQWKKSFDFKGWQHEIQQDETWHQTD
jgi:hypothetical protein